MHYYLFVFFNVLTCGGGGDLSHYQCEPGPGSQLQVIEFNDLESCRVALRVVDQDHKVSSSCLAKGQ